jgi:hypothetical protein
MRVKESASEAVSGFLPVKVDLILSNQPREARCGVEEIPRLAVRRWSAWREAMDTVSGAPAWARGGGELLLRRRRGGEWKTRKLTGFQIAGWFGTR